jgi:alpha-D-ribose 1-methylphosphonate 5-triphosphate diphosphatase
MDHTPGQRQFRDLTKLRDYVSGKYGMTEEGFARHVADQVARRDRFGAAHERAAVAAAARFGAALASHDDTTRDQVAQSAALGIRLAEFPTTVEAADACHEHGIRIIMGAPNIIRGGSHSGNVSAMALAGRDRLDVLSSDYVPSALLAAAFRLAALWDDLPRAIRTVTATPADATGLADRGRIAAGCLGDLVRVAMLDETAVVRAVWRGGERVG